MSDELRKRVAETLARAIHKEWCDGATCSYGETDYEQALTAADALLPLIAEAVDKAREEGRAEVRERVGAALMTPAEPGELTATVSVAKIRAALRGDSDV